MEQHVWMMAVVGSAAPVDRATKGETVAKKSTSANPIHVTTRENALSAR